MLIASVVIALLVAGFLRWAFIARRASTAETYAESPAWSKGHFRNVASATGKAGFAEVGRMFWANRKNRRKPRESLPIVPVRADVLSGPPAQQLQVTWLGHSTAMIEIDGLRLLTDPVLSARASPVSFAGPKRFTRPALTVEQLPRIDAVILSHDHFDHLDRDTIRALANRVGHFYIRLGVDQRLIGWGIAAERVTELDWWQ